MWTDKDREKYKDDGRRYPSDLTDAEWNIIEPLFRGYFTFTADMREVVNACFYLEHTGCQWQALACCRNMRDSVRDGLFRYSGSRLHAAQSQRCPPPSHSSAKATGDELVGV